MAQAWSRGGEADPKIMQATWTEGFKGFLSAQGELVEKLKQSGDWWIARWQSEAGLASKLVANISASDSWPETAMAWQQWSARCVEMVAEDYQHVRDDYQSFVETSTRAIWSGWSSIPKGNA